MKRIYYIVFYLSLVGACKEETTFLYEVDPLTVKQEGSEKNNLKSTTEFISIAYTDLFGKSIPSSALQSLNVIYNSFGDKKLIEDRIIRGFLNNPSAVIPSSVSVNNDTSLFITSTYKKLYNRNPNEFEKTYILELIREQPLLTPKVIYYSLMTADEYRYY